MTVLKQRARMALVEDAGEQKKVMSAFEWQERAEGSEAGQIVGDREVEIIMRMVWGIGCRPMRM